MKPLVAGTILFIAASAQVAFAQQAIDGSDEAFPSDEIKAAFSLVARSALNPTATQFRDITVSADSDAAGIYCGEVNFPNRFGGYDGFVPFWVDIQEEEIRVGQSDPMSRSAFIAVFGMIGCAGTR